MAGLQAHCASAKQPPLGATGLTTLRKLISEDEHAYADIERLYLDLRTREEMLGTALEANRKIGFDAASASREGQFKAHPAYWELLCKDGSTTEHCDKNTSGAFYCKTDDFSAAVDALFADPALNSFECGNHVQISMLRALQKAINNPTAFNKKLKALLKGKPLTIGLNAELFDFLGPKEALLPGVQVNFDCSAIPHAVGTIWENESALCVGWNASGDELFVGGGMQAAGSGETAYAMKVNLCRNVRVPPTRANLSKIKLMKQGRYLSVFRTAQ